VKVLQITRDYTNNGGIGRYVQDVTSALRDAGHDVAVICAQGPAGPDLGDVHVIPGCDEFEHAEGSRNREAVLERGVTFGPDLVMLHAMDDYALEIELRARHRVARFIHNHAYCPSGIDHAPASAHPCDRTQGASCVGGFLTRRCWFVRNPVTATHFYRRAAAAVANMRTAPLLFTASRYVRERVVRQGVDPRRLVVAPYFAELPPPPISSDATHGKTLLFAGRIVPEKGLHHVLHAMRDIDEDVRLVVNGDGPARADAEALTRQLGLEDRVDFLGWTGRDELRACYEQAAVAVVPSLWPEPFGLVGIEAMAHGVPVIGYESGAIPEWLTDGVTGHVVERGDIAGLAARIGEILSDEPLRARMSCAARRQVAEQYTAPRHLAVLCRAVGSTPW